MHSDHWKAPTSATFIILVLEDDQGNMPQLSQANMKPCEQKTASYDFTVRRVMDSYKHKMETSFKDLQVVKQIS